MNKKVCLLLALCLTAVAQSMEQAPHYSLDTLPDELKFTIACSLEGNSFLDTIKLIKQWGLVNRSWHSITEDPLLIRELIKRFKEKDRAYGLSYHERLSAAYTMYIMQNNMSDIIQDCKSLKKGTYYSEFVRAAKLGKFSLIKLLVEQDSDLNAGLFTPDSKTALDQAFVVAAKHNHADIVEYLLAKGADVHTLDLKGLSPLITAAKNNNVNIINAMLATEKIFDEYKSPAIETAGAYGHEEAAKVLLNSIENRLIGYRIIGRLAVNFTHDSIEVTTLPHGSFDEYNRDNNYALFCLIKKRHEGQALKVFVHHIENNTDKPFKATIMQLNGQQIEFFIKPFATKKSEEGLVLKPNKEHNYPTLIIQGEGLPTEGWKYTPSGNTRLLALTIAEISDQIQVIKTAQNP